MFLAIAIIPLVFVNIIIFHNYKDALEASHIEALRDTAIYKADKIESFFEKLKKFMLLSQNSYVIRQNFPSLVIYSAQPDSTEYKEAMDKFDAQIQRVQSIIGLVDIMLLNPEKKIVYSSNPEHKFRDLGKTLSGVRRKSSEESGDEICFSDIFPNRMNRNRPGMLVIGPVFDESRNLLGEIVYEADVESIYRLIMDKTGLGETGETLLVKMDAGNVLFLNPLRFDPDAALKKTVEIGAKTGVPAQEAAQGRKGAGVSIDYRGKKVIAAWRYIPSMDWGIVAKIDSEEAFADVSNLQKLSDVILVIVSILAGIMAFSVAKSISAPIQKLSDGVRMLGDGNLDISVATVSKDEIGQLSRTFDKMIRDLKATMASRDELNRKIAERRQVEQILRDSEERYRRLFETMTEGIVYQEVSGRIISMNLAAEKILGKTKDEFMGQTSESTENDCIHEDGSSFPGKEHPAMLALQTGQTVKNRIMGIYNPKERMRHWIEITAVPLFREGELRPYQVYTVFADVTSRKRFEDALRDSEMFLNETQRIARFGGWRANPDTDMLEWSESIYEIIEAPRGYKPGAAEDIRLYLPEYAPLLKEKVAGCMDTGEKFMLECQLKTFSGRILWVELRGLKRVVEGKNTYVMGTFQDITERKLGEERIRMSIQELQKANDELSRFNRLMVDRELRMVELKRRINELSVEMGREIPYCVEERKGKF